MYGTLRSEVIRWIASAIVRACDSLSITHGPAIRNSRPSPTRTGPISNVWLTNEILVDTATAKPDRKALGHYFRSELRRRPALQPVLVARRHKLPEQRMRLQRLRLELRMELAPQEIWMPGNLHDLDIRRIRRRPADREPASRQQRLVLAVELIPVPVPLADLRRPVVGARRKRPLLQHAGPRAQPHRSAHLFHAQQFAQFVDHPVLRCRIELARIRILQPAHIARKFDARRLHPQADAEIRHQFLPRIPDRVEHPFDAPLAEPARHQDAVESLELRLVTAIVRRL